MELGEWNGAKGEVSFDPGQWEATTVGDGAIIGSNATLLPVKVGPSVVVGAGAVVTEDLLEPGIYAGNPARLLRGK